MKLAGAFLALIPLAFGGMEKVWEVRLSDYLSGTDASLGLLAYDAVAAAFSPDAKFLAVTTYRDQHRAHLLVLDVASPKTAPKHFDLDSCPQDIQWSPTGAVMKICDTVLRLSDGNTCHEDRSARFVDAEQLGHFAQPNFVLDDLGCKMTASWPLDGDLVVDSAPARNLALFRSGGRLKILDVGTREVLGSWTRISSAGRAAFVAAGRTVCLSDGLERRMRCWEVSTGTEMSSLPKLNGVLDSVAASSSRILINTSVHMMVLPLDRCCDFLFRWRVYDMISGRQVASWPMHDVNGPWNICVLSPDGRFVAEGGDGVVRLYRLTP